MTRRKPNRKSASIHRAPAAPFAPKAQPSAALLPLGAMLLAGSMSAMAQQAAPAAEPAKTLAPVTVRERAEAPQGKDAVRATTATIGKGNQQLRDIPQSVTVITEKLIDDRNFDTVRDVLRNTGGVSFLAAEGGEEDIRLRGFNLQTTGDVFVDGIRDPAFYDRDTFNNDRVEILRGSASMLFGRGSTGGAVNQVNKLARPIDEHEVDVTLGNFNFRRITGDFNIRTGENAALRLNAMANTADNNGAGSSIDKKGLAGNYRFGIGTANEFSLGFYHLDNNNGMNYGMPWILPFAGAPVSATSLITKLPAEAYYGMASDYNAGQASYVTLGHTHRFSPDSELKTVIRKGQYKRDQRAGTVRFGNAASQPGGQAATLANFGPNTVFTRGTQLKIQDMDNLYAQSDYSGKFQAWGFKHEVLAGVDYAQEERQVYAALNAAQGGVNLTKPNTRAGTPDDGAWVNEGSRVLRVNNDYVSKGLGVYAQDLIQVAPHWKVLAGLRYDKMTGDYNQYTPATGAVTASYQMKVGEWSKRFGVLFQPNDLHSYYFSYGTSFNTSGEAYSLSASNVNTPPESSQNIEFGTRLETADKRFSTRMAVFRSTKLHERNTDPLIPGVTVLSGKRHAAGFEIDVAGKLTPQWEMFASYMWIPVARIDVGGQGAEAAGSRPSLTPKHSGTVWSTYQLTPKIRVGGGINFRSSQTPIRNPGWSVPSYVTADLMAEYAVVEDKFILKANINNVTDKLFADSLYSGHYIPGAARTIQVSAKYKF